MVRICLGRRRPHLRLSALRGRGRCGSRQAASLRKFCHWQLIAAATNPPVSIPNRARLTQFGVADRQRLGDSRIQAIGVRDGNAGIAQVSPDGWQFSIEQERDLTCWRALQARDDGGTFDVVGRPLRSHWLVNRLKAQRFGPWAILLTYRGLSYSVNR